MVEQVHILEVWHTTSGLGSKWGTAIHSANPEHLVLCCAMQHLRVVCEFLSTKDAKPVACGTDPREENSAHCYSSDSGWGDVEAPGPGDQGVQQTDSCCTPASTASSRTNQSPGRLWTWHCATLGAKHVPNRWVILFWCWWKRDEKPKTCKKVWFHIALEPKKRTGMFMDGCDWSENRLTSCLEKDLKFSTILDFGNAFAFVPAGKGYHKCCQKDLC